MFLRLISAIILFAATTTFAIGETNPYSSKVYTIKYQLKSTNDKIKDLQDKIDGCDRTSRGGYSCSGWNMLATGTDVAQWKKELANYKTEAETLGADLKKAQANKDLSSASKIDMAGASIDVGLLLVDVKSAEVSLKAAGIDIHNLKAKFDQTLLGDYTKYAIDNAIKSSAGQQMICKAVANCSDTKKTKEALLDVDKKVKSFEQFRSEQLELLKKSQMSTPPPKNKSLDTSGGTSI